MAVNQHRQWATINSTPAVLHDRLQWLEMCDFPTETCFQPSKFYSRGRGAYDGGDVPLTIQQMGNGEMVRASGACSEDP